MAEKVEPKLCKCPEFLADVTNYGIHICRDGKRIAPEDFYVVPPPKAA